MFTRPAFLLVPAVSLRSAQILHAVEPVERLQQLLRMRIGHPVDDLLALAAGLDEVFCTQHTELLRQGGLPDAEQLLKLPDRFFSLAQLAQQKQAVDGKDKKLSIHERLEINKRIIQEKQGKDKTERGVDLGVRTV